MPTDLNTVARRIVFLISLICCMNHAWGQTIGFSISSLDTSVAGCYDSLEVPLTIYNTGASTLEVFLSEGELLHDTLYASNVSFDDYLKINPNTMSASSTVSSMLGFAWSVEISPDGSQVWFGDNWSDSVYAYTTSDFSYLGSAPTGDGSDGIAFTPDGQYAVVASRWDDQVSLVDVATMTVLESISVDYAMDVAITSDGEYAIVVAASTQYGNKKIRLSDFTVVDEILTSWAGDARVVLTPDDQYAVVSRPWDGEIAVIDVESFTEVAIFSGFDNPLGIDVTPDGRFAYCVDRNNDAIRKINLDNLSLTSIPLSEADEGRDLEVDQFGKFIYFSTTNGMVYKLDRVTEALVDSLDIGGSIRGLDLLRSNLPWLSMDSGLIQIPSGDSLTVLVSLNAAGLNAGNYSGYIYTCSNDPSSGIDSIPVNFNVNGAAILEVDSSCLDFDTVFQFGTSNQSFGLYNAGCDTLEITNITSNLTEYTPSFTTASVLPGDSVTLEVTFTTTGTGSYPGTLTIQTNANDSNICLSAISIAGPELQFTPSSISASSSDCDDTLNYIVSVYNTGAQPLNGSIDFSEFDEPTLQEVLDSLLSSHQIVTNEIPSFYSFSEGITGSSIGDGGGDMYDGGNTISTNFGGNVAYSNASIQSSTFFGSGGEYFTYKGTGLFVLAADVNGVDEFTIDGNLGADGSGSVDTARLEVNLGSKTFVGLVKRVYNAFDPSVNHLIITEKIPGIVQDYSTDTDDDYHEVSELDGITRIYYLLYASQSGGYVDNAATQNIMQAFLDLIYTGSEFIELDTQFLSIPAGDTQNISLQITTNGILEGNYLEYLIFNTNDPVSPLDSLPVSLDFNGLAILQSQPTCLDFDTVFQFSSSFDTLFITNDGCDTLEIDSVSFPLSGFAATNDSGIVLPGDTLFTLIEFNPASTGSFTGNATIHSNVGDSLVCLAGFALSPPIMSFTPSSIDTITFDCSDTINIPLQIFNTGSAPLEVTLEESDFSSSMSLDSVLSRLQSNSMEVSDVIPSRFDFTNGTTGTYIFDGGSDMFDYGNYLRTSNGSYIPYSNNSIANSTLLGTNGEYFTHKGTGLFVFVGDLDNLFGFYTDGGTGHDNEASAMVDTLDLQMEYAGRTYQAFVKRVYGETEPSVNRMFILETNPAVYDGYNTFSSNDDYYLYNLYNTERLYMLMFGRSNGGLINRNHMLEIMRSFLQVIHGDEPWLSSSAEADTVQAGDSTTITVSLTSTGVNNGTYQGYLYLSSNDPLNALDSLSISFTIDGLPELTFDSNGCYETDSVFQFSTYTDSIIFLNSGCDTLIIDSVTSNQTYLTLTLDTTVVVPSDTSSVSYVFSPVSVGSSVDSITFHTNIGDTTICIQTHALAPPTISISPTSIDTTIVGCDDTIYVPVTIENTGFADLIFNTGELWTEGSLELDSVLSRVLSGSQSVADLVPNRFNFSDGIFGNRIVDGGSDMYDFGNYLRTNYGSYINYSNNAIATTTLLGADGRYFTHKTTGLWLMAADLDNVSYFAFDGGTGHDNNSEGTADTLDFLIDYGDRTYIGLVKRVYGETEPSVNHLVIAEYDPSIYDFGNYSVYFDDHYIYGLNNADRLYALVFSSQSGGQIQRNEFRSIMLRFLDVIHGDIPWAELGVGNDTIAPGDSINTQLMLTSNGLVDGIHEASIIIGSNDPLSPTDSINIVLDVQGDPELWVDDSGCVVIDTIFQFDTYTDTFVIANTGCDTLVIDSLYSNVTFLSLSSDTQLVAPGDTQTLTYTFSPTAVGSGVDTLIISTNDGDTAICVQHAAVAPPTIVVNPTFIDTTILGCDDTLLIPVSINNTGSADLIYSTQESSNFPIMTLDSVMARLVSGSGAVSSVIPNRFDFSDGITGSYIADGGNDMYDFGNYLRTNFGSYITYSNNAISNTSLLGSSTPDYFTHKGTGLFVFAGNLDNLYGFYFDGGTGHDNNTTGTADTLNLSIDYNGTTYLGFVKRVYGETEPSVNHLVIVEDDPSVFQSYSTNVYNDDHYIYGLNNVDRLYALVFGEVSGGATTRSEFETIMQSFLNVIHGGESWMSFSNTLDTIAPGDSINGTVRLTSFGLSNGTYNGYFAVHSNDPLLPLDSIVVSLDVVGTPEFTASVPCVDFDSVMQYTTAVDTIMIFNNGCDTLEIDSVFSSFGILSSSLNDTVLAPYDSLVLDLVFAPLDSGQVSDTLWFETNIGDQSICAFAYAVPPPIIVADTDTLDLELYGCCDTFNYPITIYNTGYTDLEVDVESDFDNDLQDILDRFNANFTDITSEIPFAYNFTDFPATTYISDGGNDMYDTGNRLNTNLAFSIPYSNNTVSSSTSFGANGAYFTSKVTSMWMMAADLDGITSFSLTGGLGADGSGSLDYTTISLTHEGVDYTGFIKRVYNAFDPSVNHLIIVPEATGVTQTGSFNTNDDDHTISGLGSTDRIYYLLFARQNGGFIDNTSMTNIMQAFLETCVVPNVVSSVSPMSATVAPGDSALFDVTIVPCEIDTGNYVQPVVFSSNDPLTPELEVVFDVRRDSLPPAPIRADTGICFGDPSPILTAVGENIRWYDDTSLTNLVDTGNTLDSTMTAIGTYVFYLTQTIDSCEGLVDTFIFQVNTPPVNVTAADTYACESGTIPDLTAAGNNVYWFSDSSLSTLEHVGDTFATGESTFGFYTYYLFDSVSGCPASQVDTVTLFIDSIPAAPPVTDTTICITDSVPALSAIGDSIHWYSDPALTTLLTTGNSYTPVVVVPGNYNYYVVEIDTLTACFSNYEVATLTVQAAPIAPVASDDTACFGSSIPSLTAAGTNLSWYSDAALTTLVNTGATFATGITAVGTYHYYVTQSSGTCEGPADTATLVISAPPATPVALDTAICQGESTPQLIAAGSGLRWYSDTGLTSLVHVGDTFSPSVSAVGIYNYYVTEISGGCEGDADTSTLVINALPSTPLGTDKTTCFGQTVPDLTANGAWNQWYSDSTLSTLLDTGSALATGQTAVGVYNYYVTDLDSITGCESQADTVTLVINTAPVQPSATDTSVCENEPIPSLTAGGSNIQWYSDGALTTLVFSGNTFTTGETTPGIYTFFVTDSLSGCPEGPADTSVLEIRAIPVSPIVSDTAVCFGDSVPSLINGTMQGDSRWYSDASLTTLVSSQDTFITGQTAVGAYTYYVVRDSGSCFSTTDSVILDIIGIPSAPLMSDTSFCEGSAEVPLVAIGTSIQWYSDTTLSAIVSGDSLYTGQTVAGSYTYYATQGLNGCVGPADSATLTILPIPSSVVALDTAICEGDSVPALISTGSNVEWYSDSNLSTLEDTGNAFTPVVSSAGVYTFYVIQNVLGCASLPDTAELVVNAIPTAPTALDTAVCVSDPVPDLTAIGTGLIWYSDTGLSTQIDTGGSYSTGQSTPGSYSYYVTQTILGCESEADTSTLVINAAPTIPSVDDSSICFGDSIPTFVSTGVNVYWFDTSGTQLGTGNSFTPIDSLAGMYLYLVRDSLPGCPISNPDTAVFTVFAEPSTPIANDTAICFGQTVPDLTAVGQDVEWFSDSGLTTLVDTGSSLTTGQSAVGSYTYYARQSVNGCEGPPASVTLTIAPVPTVPSANDTTICFGEGAILYASGSNLIWYDNSSLTNVLGTGDTLVLSSLDTGLTSVFVTDSLAGCPASDADSTFVDVIPLPDAPTGISQTICDGDSIPDLIASGIGLRWFSDSSLLTQVDTGNSITPTTSGPGVYAYYVTQAVNGCEGDWTLISLTIDSIPSVPTASDTTICEGGVIPALTAQGTSLNWYSDTALTSLIVASDSFVPSVTLPGQYDYYVTRSIGICESGADTSTLIILPTPSSPITSDTAICFGQSVPNLVAIGANIQWFSDSIGGTPIAFGDSLATGQTTADTHTYYAAEVLLSCESPRVAASLIIHPTPSLPTGNDTSICLGESLPYLYATGIGLTWYEDAGLLTQAGTGDSILMTSSTVGSDSFYVTQTINGCEGPAEMIIFTINPIPSAPSATDASFCIGSSVPSLNATGSNVSWYSDSTLTVLVNSGSSYTPSISIAGTYEYYVTQEVNGCESEADTSTVVAFAEPSVPTVNDTTVCFGDSIPTFISGDSNSYWYDDPSLSSAVDSGSSFTPSVSVSGSYTFYVRNIENGCEGDTSSFVLLITTPPSAPQISDSSVCEGIEGVLVASGQGVEWYSDFGLLNLVNEGDTFNTGIDSVGSYTFFATQTINGCVGEIDSAVLIVNPSPEPPVASDTSLCEGSGLVILNATGTNVTWYADPSLDSVLSTLNSYQPDSLAVGIYHYYVTQSALGCESQPDTSTVTVFSTPNPPIVSNQVACEGADSPVVFALGESITWYTGTNGFIDTGNVLDTTLTNAGSYVFYATQTIGGCESESDSLLIEIIPIPDAPTVNDSSACFGAVSPSFVLNGVEAQWFDNMSLMTPVFEGDTFVPNEENVGIYTYYVTIGDSGCRSAADTFQLMIMPSPLVTLNTYSTQVQIGDSVLLEAFNAQSYSWSPTEGLNLVTGPIVWASPSVTTIYTVTGTNEEGCSRDTSVLVSVMPLGIDLTQVAWQVKAFPNPTRDVLHLNIGTQKVTDFDLELYGNLGERVYSEHIPRDAFGNSRRWESTLDLTGFAAGVYTLSVRSEDDQEMLRIIIQ